MICIDVCFKETWKDWFLKSDDIEMCKLFIFMPMKVPEESTSMIEKTKLNLLTIWIPKNEDCIVKLLSPIKLTESVDVFTFLKESEDERKKIEKVRVPVKTRRMTNDDGSDVKLSHIKDYRPGFPWTLFYLWELEVKGDINENCKEKMG